MATFNAIFAKVPWGGQGVPYNCEIWIQGPEPYATKIADAAVEPANPQINGLQTDTWYDIYAKAPPDADQGFSYIFATGIFGPVPVPPCCNNPVLYHFWFGYDFLDNVRVERNTQGGTHYSGANAQVPAGTTKWVGSVYVVDRQNTVQPANPVPVSPGGGGGGGGGGFPWPDLSFMTTEMWIIAGAAVGLIVLAASMGGD